MRLAETIATAGLMDAMMPGVGLPKPERPALAASTPLKRQQFGLRRRLVGAMADVAVSGTDLGTAGDVERWPRW